MKRSLIILSLFFFGAASAGAEPLVTMSGDKASPGVITAWKAKGKKVELTVKSDADTKAVMQSIKGGVERVRVKLRGGKILVVGKSEAELLKALSEIDFGGEDDTIGLLADAADTSESFGSGSSLRAKTTAKKGWASDPKATAIAQVVAVKRGECFPLAEVVVRVLRGPTGPLKKAAKKGAVLTLKPAMVMTKAKKPVLKDDAAVDNAGAWFLKKGDKVDVKLGRRLKAKLIQAERIQRR